MAEKVTKDEADADLQRVAEKLGKPPTIAEYREHGEHSVPTVAKFYDGSFVQARETLGLSDGRLASIMRSELLEDIQRVVNIVGGEPSKADYKEHGEHALSTITYRFESWVAAKKEAGVYEGLAEPPAKDKIAADMRRVDDETDGALSQSVYRENGEYYPNAAKRLWGGWEMACQDVGVTRPYMGPKQEPDEVVLQDLRDVTEKLGHTPSKSEYDEHGEFTYGILQTRFFTISNACRQAGLEPRPEGGQPGELNSNWKGGYGGWYGQNWPKQKRAARERDGRCMICGISSDKHRESVGEALSVHHIERFDSFESYEPANRLENLICLCRQCHGEIPEGDPQTQEKMKRLITDS